MRQPPAGRGNDAGVAIEATSRRMGGGPRRTPAVGGEVAAKATAAAEQSG